ncbi:MAG: YraN family protein [Dysgonomonas sp.]
MAEHNDLGRVGEDLAAKFLIDEGYILVSRNWRCGRIEIDLIVKSSDYIVFVEVKTRTSDHWGQPEDAVDERRIRNMTEAADYYVQENDIDLPVRFDVISILFKGKDYTIHHIDDAFFAPLN